MNRLHAAWLRLCDSVWFIPSVMIALSTAAGVWLVSIDRTAGDALAAGWPRLFGTGVEGARAMLAAIATSMVTVAGVVFSATIVVLSLAASQYSPHVLRHFLADWPTRIVLGAFVSIFAYCVVVLRATRGPGPGEFVPAAAVFGGVCMAFVGIALLVWFVHHVSQSIRVSSILQRVARETAQAIDRNLLREPGPQDAGGADRSKASAVRDELAARWHPVTAPGSGYVVRIDDARLVEVAHSADVVVRVVPLLDGFVIEGRALAQVGGEGPPSAALCTSILRCFELDRQRTLYQDPCFGLQQIVDVAVKSLSTGINDPTTATLCVNHLAALLHRVAGRPFAGPRRKHAGTVRLVVPMPDFDAMVSLALDPVIRQAGSHAEVLGAVCACLEVLCDAVHDPARLPVLARKLGAVAARAAEADLAPDTRRSLLARADALRQRISRRIA